MNLKYHKSIYKIKSIFIGSERKLDVCEKPALPPKTIWLYDFHINYLSHDFFISKVTVVVDNICQWKF